MGVYDEPFTWSEGTGGTDDLMSKLQQLAYALQDVNPNYNPAVFEDPVGATPIRADRLQALENGLHDASTAIAGLGSAGIGTGPALVAPAPSGGDDTAVLMGLVATAQASGGRGTIWLQAGVYRCNLLFAQSFITPLLIGQGAAYTTLQGFTSDAPVVKFRGGSAGKSMGGLRDLAIKPAPGTTNGLAIVFSGCTTLKIKDVNIAESGASTFAEGVRFWNELGFDFTEFCTFEGGSISGCIQPIKYRVDNGVESFHGSGVMGHTLINMIAGSNTPVITIDDGVGLPYNAPMEFDAFLGATHWLIYNGCTAANRFCSFWGHISLEGSNSNGKPYGTGTNQILFEGTISHLGSSQMRLGNIYLCDKIGYVGSTIVPRYKPMQFALKGAASTVVPLPALNGEQMLLSVNIVASGYHKVYTLLVWQSPYNPGGTVMILATGFSNDSVGWGEPVFAWANYDLVITSSRYSSTTNIYIGAVPLFGTNTAAGLVQ